MTFLRSELENRPILLGLFGAIIAIMVRTNLAWGLLLIGFLIVISSMRSRLWLAISFALFATFVPSGFNTALPMPQFPLIGEVVSPVARGPIAILFTIDSHGNRYEIVWVNGPKVDLGDQIEINRAKLAASNHLSPNLTGLKVKKSDAVIIGRASAWLRWSTLVHDDLVTFVSTHVHSDSAMAINGLVLDATYKVSPNFKLALQSDGLLFLVSISGLHVFILAYLVKWLLPYNYIPRPFRIVILGLFLIFLCAATSFHAATVRAAIAVIGREMAYFYRREPDSLSLLALGGLVYLAWRPEACFEPGFQLSMLAVGLIACGELLISNLEWVDLLKVGGLGWLGSTPIAAYWFGTISWIGAISGSIFSLLLLPLISLTVLAFVFQLLPGFGTTFGLALDVLGHLVYAGIMRLSLVNWISSAWTPSRWMVLFITIGIFMVVWTRRRRAAPKRL